MLEPNKEQTTLWASFVFYSFLDGLIGKASNVPHLPADEFPPLVDYDLGSNLMRKSFPVSDRVNSPHPCSISSTRAYPPLLAPGPTVGAILG